MISAPVWSAVALASIASNLDSSASVNALVSEFASYWVLTWASVSCLKLNWLNAKDVVPTVMASGVWRTHPVLPLTVPSVTISQLQEVVYVF